MLIHTCIVMHTCNVSHTPILCTYIYIHTLWCRNASRDVHQHHDRGCSCSFRVQGINIRSINRIFPRLFMLYPSVHVTLSRSRSRSPFHDLSICARHTVTVTVAVTFSCFINPCTSHGRGRGHSNLIKVLNPKAPVTRTVPAFACPHQGHWSGPLIRATDQGHWRYVSVYHALFCHRNQDTHLFSGSILFSRISQRVTVMVTVPLLDT